MKLLRILAFTLVTLFLPIAAHAFSNIVNIPVSCTTINGQCRVMPNANQLPLVNGSQIVRFDPNPTTDPGWVVPPNGVLNPPPTATTQNGKKYTVNVMVIPDPKTGILKASATIDSIESPF